MENYGGILDSSQVPRAKRELTDCKRVAIGPASAEQISSPADLVRMREEGSVELIPPAGLTQASSRQVIWSGV
jgi:hypothetical protein